MTIFVISILIMAILYLVAPEGWEDAAGFHYGKKG